MRFKSAYLAMVALFFWVSALADLPSSIARVKPSVVVLGSYNPTNSPRFTLRGTGFVVGRSGWGDSNLIITNAHVLVQPAEDDTRSTLVVQLKRGPDKLEMRRATVLEVDKHHDLALLQMEGTAVPGLAVRESESVQEGQAIAFMGFPIGGALGFSPVTHRGTISSIAPAALPTPTAQQLNEKAVRGLRSGSFNIFQLDGTAYPGNSGGPLFDPETGDVLGVVNMVFIKGTRETALSNPSGISYAIPAGFILQLLKRADTSALPLTRAD